jgi:ATP-binding cassette subfamily B protein
MQKTLFPFIIHFLKSRKPSTALLIFLAICAGFWGPLNSLFIKYMIDLLPQDSDIDVFTFPAILIILNFIIFNNVTWRGIGYIKYKCKPDVQNQIIRETLKYCLGHSHGFFQDNLSGKIANQISTLAENITKIIYSISADFLRGLSVSIISFITAYYVNPVFCYILLLWFIAFSIISMLISKHLLKLSSIHAASESALSGQLVDCVTNNNNVRIFAKKDYEIMRMEEFFSATKTAYQNAQMYNIILNIAQGLMITIMIGLCIYCLINLHAKNMVTIGDFALILGLSVELGHLMWYTMYQVDEFNIAVGKCNQSISAIMIDQEITDKPNSAALSIKKGEIIFDKVGFRYKNGEKLFWDKSIKIEAGQKVGLVGYSGGGKTSFVNLILRIYDLHSGRILIDGQDIATLVQDSVRQNISMIPQDPMLFQRSLMENIRYGNTCATDAEIILAATKAHAHEFIQILAQNYDSLVGERGVKLSGGQRQRIAIARAILKNAPILILDEATSQLDSVSEKLIQASLWDLMQDKTTIVIAHRLSTLLKMDRILVFDKGDIVEDGTHDELLLKSGLYKKLWDAQVGGFLGDALV